GFDQISAQGINLIYFIPIAALSVIIPTKNGLIHWEKIFPAIAAGIAFSAAGAVAAKYFGSPALKKIFAVFILLIGVKELLYKPKDSSTRGSSEKQDRSPE
ncbi:MAG: TSUP family transporter, partial [Oscillospiraceae bacterium]|nr:TSUP family transporter [Oscillospiraceae bacterium]